MNKKDLSLIVLEVEKSIMKLLLELESGEG